ncbi:DUF7678 domain-containing protein [Butyrivibrio hungatei]|uniref:DUF7678 domain-containing protein n=1 Tax=Butyrivibrio hungatei TaxID=185008 RepID=A0A1D9P0E0_9FIRM|nr:hypothetical protein [Butyrivibrio hungatei]AOZ95939.1 hypothetical protein bhn_I0905 [Butyrivibrio hungatei]
MWHEGTIGIPVTTKDKKTKIAHYWVKSYDEGSKFGINGGRISKLMIKIDGQTVVSYDSGWDIEPDENDQTVMSAYSICLQDYN